MKTRPTWGDWLVALLLASTMIFSLVDRFALSLLTQDIKADLLLSDRDIGLLNGVAFGLFYAIIGLPLGWLADRWSRVGTILLGLAVWSVATAMSGLASSFTALLLARIFVGAGEAGLAPASYSILHQRFPKRSLNKAISLFQAGGMFGSGAALLVSAIIYNFFQNGGANGWPFISGLKTWQQTFIAVAAPGIPFFILLSFLREDRSGPTEASGRHGEVGSETVSMIEALRSNPLFYGLIFLGMAAILSTNYALLNWVAPILSREFGYAPREVGNTYGAMVMVICPVSMLLAGVVCDHLVQRGVKQVQAKAALLASVVMLAGMIAIGLASRATEILIIAGIVHFMISIPQAVVPALLQVETPHSARGQVSAFYVLVVNITGLGLGPVIIGSISTADMFGASSLRYAVSWFTVPFLAIAVLALILLLRRNERLAAAH